jgi:hypothetical protein
MEPGEPGRVERRLAAILAADVAGYSRLIEADEEGTLSRLKALRAELIDPKITSHHGRIVKTTGDGLLVEFASVVDALRCAAEMQAAMGESNDPLAPDRRIEFRIGINVGDIVVEDGDIFGDGVNVAAVSKAWPNRAASASRPAFRRMPRAASSSPSRTQASRRSRTSPGRCGYTGFTRPPPKILQHQLNRCCRSPTSRRSQSCPSPI